MCIYIYVVNFCFLCFREKGHLHLLLLCFYKHETSAAVFIQTGVQHLICCLWEASYWIQKFDWICSAACNFVPVYVHVAGKIRLAVLAT